jgi:hypothetical protein
MKNNTPAKKTFLSLVRHCLLFMFSFSMSAAACFCLFLSFIVGGFFFDGSSSFSCASWAVQGFVLRPPSSTARLLHDNLQLSFQDNQQQRWQWWWQGERRIRQSSILQHSTLTPPEQQQLQDTSKESASPKRTVNIVLVTGFESFNRDLYRKAGQLLPRELVDNVRLHVFADADIRASSSSSLSTADEATTEAEVEAGVTNNEFAKAVQNADIFIASLIFDYDDVVTVSKLLDQQQLAGEAEVKAEQQQQQQQQQQQHPKKIRLLFECATELMSYNQVGSFTINQSSEGGGGPPPPIKAILNKFSSGKEEDKINGYLKMLKVGPDLLKFIPG